MLELYRRLTSDETSHPLLVPVRAIIRWSTVFYRQLHWDRAFVRAAAMAYTTLIAFVPLMLLVFGILTGSGVLQQDQKTLETIVFSTFVGDIPGIQEFLMPGLLGLDLRTLSLLGVAGLLFVAARLFLMVERAYNDIFKLQIRRKMSYRLLNFYFTITALPVLGGVFVIGAVDAMGEDVSHWTFLALEFVVAYSVLLAALKLFPCTPVHWKPAMMGALVSVCLLIVGRFAFHYYLLWFKADDPLNVIYGSLALIPIFLVWLYLVWVVVLLGVEVAYVGQNFGTLWAAEQEQLLTTHQSLRVPSLATVLGVLMSIARQHEAGEEPLRIEDIARVSGLSQRALHPLLEVLLRRGWVVETERGWVLAKSAAAIDLQDVGELWNDETAPDGPGQSETVSHVQHLYRENQREFLQGTVKDALDRWS